MIIKLADMDLSSCTTAQQAKKVNEEFNEFIIAQAGGCPDLKEIAAEFFDFVQAGYGYLKKLGIDVEVENIKHLKKLDSLGNKPREGRGGCG